MSVDLVLSPSHRLPADVRAAARDATERIEALASAVPGVAFTRVDPTELDDAQRAALPVRERTIVREEGGLRVARNVTAGLVVRVGDRTTSVDLEDARAFEACEFRLAHALWRLTEDRSALVAVASSTPRLSSAEAHLEYQQLQLFAPTGSDVFSGARDQLVRSGFDVVHVDPERPRWPREMDALVWLQPRREIDSVLARTVEHLRDGGGACIAGQHFELVAKQLEGSDLELVHWPRPTNCDLDARWFADVGASVARSIVLDDLVFASEADVRAESEARGKVTERQDSAPPFQVRVGSSTFAPGPPTEGLRDLPWYGGDPVVLDRERLEATGLSARVLLRASSRAWTFPWKGGFVPADVLEGPSEAAPAEPDAPLAVEVEGAFPAVDGAGHAVPGSAVGAERGRLVLLGSSSLFTNGNLFDERFGSRELLTAIAAHLALPEDVAVLAEPTERTASLGFVEERERLAARAYALAAPLVVALLLGLVRLVANARRRVRA
ncbi:MAG: Gldg family protein [Planctomycetota bacterium]